MATASKKLHNQTPLMYSTELSRKLQTNVWLKLEALQPSGSFKIRGLGHMCLMAFQRHGKDMHLVCSSGGNAGLAVAYTGRQLDCKTTIVVPQSTSLYMREKLQLEGATVIVEGEAWDDADKLARTLVDQDPHGVYIPPFDHPDIWEGNSTMVDELKVQLGGAEPDAIICSVGGGGLLCGVIEGCQRAGWKNTPVLAIETHGASSFNQAVKAGKLVTLPKITTIATTLGAKCVAARALDLSMIHPVVPFAVSDAMAVRACWEFLDDHRLLVEPSCGAALSALYTPDLLRFLFPHLTTSSNVVVIVCGGSNITFEMLKQYQATYMSEALSTVAIRNGDRVMLKMVNHSTTAATASESNGTSPANEQGTQTVKIEQHEKAVNGNSPATATDAVVA
ncbi:hypothetical protein DFQ26_001118 [Actinomortierella ambigua]|nr:hypothetical protein DFQ26_001118 [Actinomortierella ambigua]